MSLSIPSKVLVVGPSWVGDMVMAEPFLRAIKTQLGGTLTLLAPPWSAPLAARMKGVDNLIPLPFKHGELNLKARWALAQQIKAQHFTAAYVLPNSFKSALIPWLAKIPQRIGFRGEWRYGALNEVRLLDKQKYPRLVDRYYSLAFPTNETVLAPPPQLTVNKEDARAAAAKLGIVLGRPALAICPGAEFGTSKRWPEEYYAKVASAYLARNWDVWLLGSKNDVPVTNRIQELCHGRLIDLSGKTILAEAIDLLSLSQAVVTNDSGLMHIAASFDKPLVAIYGSTDPGYTPPLGEKATIVREPQPCSPCFKRECPLTHHQCMRSLTPEKVLAALSEKIT